MKQIEQLTEIEIISSILNGDISRYVAISNNNGRPIVDAIKFRDSPRSDLYERLITFYK